MALNRQIEDIIKVTAKMTSFWSVSHGWASDSAAFLMSKSRLDWQLSLSKSLKNWVQNDNLSDGDLILAWTNLGALVEGALKLYLSVYYEGYKKDVCAIKNKKGGLKDPDVLKLEELRQFIEKNQLLVEWHGFVKKIQQRRNAIHAFEHRDIGDCQDFSWQVENYRNFLLDIDAFLPYP